jgi:hypothetical protein
MIATFVLKFIAFRIQEFGASHLSHNIPGQYMLYGMTGIKSKATLTIKMYRTSDIW